MIKNTIYLHTLADVAVNQIKTELGDISLKKYCHFHKIELPNDDPYYYNVKNLHYKTKFKSWNCEFVITIHDHDILNTLLSVEQKRKCTDGLSRKIFKQLTDVPNFVDYLCFKDIMSKDKHVRLKVYNDTTVHSYRFDSDDAIYYNDKLLQKTDAYYLFLQHILICSFSYTFS
jgi:hypothetical protein